MTTLVLVSCFSAFFLAFFERFTHLGILKVVVSLVFSVTGCLLLGNLSLKQDVVYVGASCFLAPFLALASEKLATLTKTVVVPPRRNL